MAEQIIMSKCGSNPIGWNEKPNRKPLTLFVS